MNKKNNTERDSMIFKEVLNGQSYTAVALIHELSVSRPAQIVKQQLEKLLTENDTHPFTKQKYPHAYCPRDKCFYPHLLQQSDLHAEKQFLLSIYAEYNKES